MHPPTPVTADAVTALHPLIRDQMSETSKKALEQMDQYASTGNALQAAVAAATFFQLAPVPGPSPSGSLWERIIHALFSGARDVQNQATTDWSLNGEVAARIPGLVHDQLEFAAAEAEHQLTLEQQTPQSRAEIEYWREVRERLRRGEPVSVSPQFH
jgi:hypothetical protein